jgi:iron(III) transport system substrate-binding protein
MKKIRNLLLAAIGALAAAAPAARAQKPAMPDPSDTAKLYEMAKQEGQMVLYHGAPEGPMRQVVAQFAKQYPGIAVSTVKASGVAVYQRFAEETQAHQYIADVVHFSDYPTMVQAIKDGMYASWKIPNYDSFAAPYKIGTYSYALYLNDVAIAYNPNKVSPEEVKLLQDWHNLANPRFKGRIALYPESCATCYGIISMFLDPKMPGFGLDFLKRLAANKPGVFDSTAQALDRVIAGQYDITISFEGLLVAQWEHGAPIRWIHPKPTPLIVAPMIGVSATAPHPAAARLFLNWLASPAGAVVMQKEMGAITSISGVPDQRPVIKQPWYSPITDPYHPDMERWSNDYDKEMAIWSRLLKQSTH